MVTNTVLCGCMYIPGWRGSQSVLYIFNDVMTGMM